MRFDPVMSQQSEDNPILENTVTYHHYSWLLGNIITICLGPIFFGYSMAYLSIFPIEQIRTEFKITMSAQSAQGVFNGIVPLGALMGAALSSIISKSLSRRNSLLFVCGLGFIGGLLTLYSSFSSIVFGRLLEGLCVGLYSSICPLYINQLSPPELSGFFGSMNQIFIITGVLLANTFSLFVTNDNRVGTLLTQGWRFTFAFPVLLVVVQTVLLLTKYSNQTPRYLISVGRDDEARDLIEKIYLPAYSEVVYDRISRQLRPRISQEESTQKVAKSKSSPLAILMGFHVAILQQLSGINVVVIYGLSILLKIVGEKWFKLCQISLQVISLIGCFAAASLIKRMGRKTLLQIGALGLGILLGIIGTCYIWSGSKKAQYVILVSLYLFYLIFGFTLGPVVWLYIPEILKPSWIPFTTLTNWIFCLATILLFPILTTYMGTPVYIFYFLSSWCVGSFVVNHFLLVESKDKSASDIDREYKQKCL